MPFTADRATGKPEVQSCTRCDHSDFCCDHEPELDLIARLYKALRSGQPAPAELLAEARAALEEGGCELGDDSGNQGKLHEQR
jgi:hypothetical protein